MTIDFIRPPRRADHRPGFRKTTCRSCGDSFQDLSGLQLCDTCMADRVNGAGELELDDPDDVINWSAPHTTDRTARRQCRVCDAPYTVALDYDGLPLCGHCAADVPATRRRVLAWLDDVLAQMDAAIAEFDAVRARHPDEWAKLETALEMRADGRATEAQLAARWAARMQDPNPAWPALLRAYEEREVALAPLRERRARLEAAERAIQ